MQSTPLHEKSHWVSETICIGANPLVNFFWFLEEPDYDQKKWYIISLIEDTPNVPARLKDTIKLFQFPITHNSNSRHLSQKLAKLIDFVEARMKEGYYIYLHCREGIGRSNMIAAILLARSNNWDLKTTLLSNGAERDSSLCG